ncbi:MAG: sigma-70 family RNA polymerase sigma factor [Coriobacteriia bacterium]|nr:sigma-70 family RNA polymerase sigma factor [Coriobacteriia bacterium]
MSIRAFSMRGLALRRTSDEALLEYAREGQEIAFAELYRRFHGLVYGYCLARLMDPAAAEDVAQETFMRINRSRSSETIHSARAWVFTVARSAVIDHVRRAKRMPDSLPVDDAFELAAANSDAADGMMRREDAKLVFLALARLRPRYRSALVLREMHGLSSAEIGESLSLKAGAVDTLVCRARDAFGREYAALGDLRSDCRRAVEYIYRDRGTGIAEAERGWLTSHVSTCPRCARERLMAADPKRLAFLLPFASIHPEGIGLLRRAVEAFGAAPVSLEGTSLMAAKVTAVAIAATLAIAPGLSHLGPEKPEGAARPTSVARTAPAVTEPAQHERVVVEREAPSRASVVETASVEESASTNVPGAAVVVVEGPTAPEDELISDVDVGSDATTPPVSAAGTETLDPPVDPGSDSVEPRDEVDAGTAEQPSGDAVEPGAPPSIETSVAL